ncbi:MAG TPA: archaemetzincin family Zn-dependent metalloprotease [Bacteroidota bacterium]|nr:archaemetzincin family Zn-dependent metalloprotease [Bacteroidota bacterium]
MSAIHLLPLGGASTPLAEMLQGNLERIFRADVLLRDFPLDLEQFFDQTRGQYNSTSILMHLKAHYAPLQAPGSVRVLGIVPFDLFIPILTHVFGEAELGGNVAVVSYYRLAPERYGLPPDDKLFTARLIKEVVHELGHAHALTHCSTYSCVMHSSSYVEEIDLKESTFCSPCAREMRLRARKAV